MSSRVWCGECVSLSEMDLDIVRESDRRLIAWYLPTVLKIEAGVSLGHRTCPHALIKHCIVTGRGESLCYRLTPYGKVLLKELRSLTVE